MNDKTYSVAHLRDLAMRVLMAHDVGSANAAFVADALIAAQVDGHGGHGLSRLAAYSAQAASGKVDGHAVPVLREVAPAAVRIDAANGFAYPAMVLAVDDLVGRATKTGIAAATVCRSHHFGAAGYHVEKLAAKGLIGLVFGNSPRAIAPWGGRKGVFGTNPIAFAAPRADGAALLIDLSLSKVARGRVMLAAKLGDAIPEGWALDRDGHPTTDAKAALEGTMLPMGGAKGAALVLMVEILAAALSGAHFGYEASSFFEAEGAPPGVGQCLIAIDPAPFSGGGFAARLEALLAEMLSQDGVRLPGARRLHAREAVQKDGVPVPNVLYDELVRLAG
ncbi:Ldh family oxidoreductase [Varunaivibrio sulfuroxidans]|uniref:(2R)-3-sulfolactate dehydrogenase (NADP+) n=1 Tax=Varunaivibrio sulfuroxidans TaxID=1773489 RepID=A0A4R3JEJ4_9PROT|nr:Ldh family oxidoreductase [Varunaivibrio sulfuroxidans]TCS63090.1 (2R)-3-sulfolactate dehydrogenase (NADP+) [Varunaivibrio sulfuroxidans]WES31838.1 Ldh family oxidoreductase [Varunaivibrio sulfuroxidans]